MLAAEGQVNTVKVYFLNKYRKDGVGLHSFTDKVDAQQYLYTQFEADFCHYVFPCFDQPDLKASWKLECETEGDWTVIANEAPLNEEPSAEQRIKLETECSKAVFLFQEEAKTEPSNKKQVHFSESFKISTYLYAIVAGPFDFHERQTEGYPLMRIYARKSLIQDVNHEEMFNVTEAGMAFYKEFFGKPYPFRKYDQVFVPEHNFGAMENVGCVTYNENYMYRGQTPTLAKLLRFSITNLHELAHMWFGNLVTMTWWNDLWLNESFATFMSFLAMSRSPRLQHYHATCWVTFLQYKFWGISKDCMSSTHPICCEIVATDQAESLFDGISYGKGSAFLKQFFNILGFDTMSAGLHLYFQRYEWGNTTLPDFVSCLVEAYQASEDTSLGANFDMTQWCDEWLKTSGVNTLEPILELDNGQLRSLKIRQGLGVRGKNRLRLQKLNIGIYEAGAASGAPIIVKDVIISQTEEITEVDISSLPQDLQFGAVFLNQDEHAYAKVRFDDLSIDWFTQNLNSIDDPLTRAAIWRYFWMLVMDRKMSSLKYMDFVQLNLPNESVEQILSVGLMNLRVLISNYIPLELVKDKKNALFQTLVALLSKEGVQKDPIVDQLFGTLASEENIRTALNWMEQSKITDSEGQNIYELKTAHKHAILKVVFKSLDFTTEQKIDLLETTLGEDKSDLSENCRAACMAGLPDPEVKARVWQEVTDPNSTDSVYVRNAKMSGFYSFDQIDIIEPYFDKFFDILHDQHENSTHKKFEGFFYSMLPRMIVKDNHIVRLVTILQDTSDSQIMFQETIRDGIDLLVRTQQVRAFAQREMQAKL